MVKGLGEGHKWAHRLMAFNGPSAWSLDAINDAMRSRLLKHRKVVENHPAFKKLQANTHFKIAEARFNDKSGAKRTSHPFSYYRFIFVTCYSLAWFLIQSDKQMRFSPRPLREIRTAQKQLNSLEASFAHLRIDKKTDFIDLGFLLGAYEADHLDTAKKVRRKPRVDASYPQREFLRVASNGLRTQCGDSIPPNIRVSILNRPGIPGDSIS